MSGLSVILLVLFVIVCVLIVFLVLLQNEEGDSIGGLFAGGSGSAFGSKSGNVLTKTTYVLVILFFMMSFGLALLNRSKSDKGLLEEAQKQQVETGTEWFNTEKKDEAQIPEVKELSELEQAGESKADEQKNSETAEQTAEEISANVKSGNTAQNMEAETAEAAETEGTPQE